MNRCNRWQTVSLSLLLACSVSGQVIDWANPAGGSWHDPTNWSPPNVPDEAGETARIAVPGAYTIELEQDAELLTLEVLNPQATVRLVGGIVLGIYGSEILNDGLIEMVREKRFPAIILHESLTLRGSGTLVGTDDRFSGQFRGGCGVTLVNGIEHTIGGGLGGTVHLRNYGVLEPTGIMPFSCGVMLEPTTRVRLRTDRFLGDSFLIASIHGAIHIDGTLEILAPDELFLEPPDAVACFKSSEPITGDFHTMVLPEVPNTVVFRDWRRDPDPYAWYCLEFACLADLSGSSDPNNSGYGKPDNRRDADDFFTFLDFYATDDERADLTGSTDPGDPGYRVPDGVIDILDFEVFLEAMTEQCP